MIIKYGIQLFESAFINQNLFNISIALELIVAIPNELDDDNNKEFNTKILIIKEYNNQVINIINAILTTSFYDEQQHRSTT